jgi:hypothetical protein
MLSWKDIKVAELHYKELLQEAERYRMVGFDEEAGRKRRPTFLSRPILWIAKRLIEWGSILQKRYGSSTIQPT